MIYSKAWKKALKKTSRCRWINHAHASIDIKETTDARAVESADEEEAKLGLSGPRTIYEGSRLLDSRHHR
jgi:hypothetical protein